MVAMMKVMPVEPVLGIYTSDGNRGGVVRVIKAVENHDA